MASQPAANPLVSRGGSSELHVILHPLVLLTISDYIARHTLQKREGQVIGALLGQQNGREITIEHAFEAGMPTNKGPVVNEGWFSKRLEQMKIVHKDRQLDFVGWFTLLPSSGPVDAILPTHRFFAHRYNESAIFLAFYPDGVLNHSAGGQLPLTIYESNWEVETDKPTAEGEDRNMDDGTAEKALQLRFRELTYSVETEETEMIGMNYVAAAGGGAAATSKEEKTSRSIEANGKGKRRLVEADEEPAVVKDDDTLTQEEEEMIAALTTKANAVKMLRSRIDLITKYLQGLPSAFVNGEKSDDETMDTDGTTPSLSVLRQIQALISRLDLIIPSDKDAFEMEMLQEANDVNLVQLLNEVMQNANQAREVGKKYGIVEGAKHAKARAHDQNYGQHDHIGSLLHTI